MSGQRARTDPAHPPRGLDFSASMRRVCESICATLGELAHVDMRRVGVGFAQTRRTGRFGMLASLTPLRFAGGAATSRRRGREYTVQRVVDANGVELLYLLTFYLPRFLELDFEEKLTTVVHELWHIGPAFDGDIRRHEGRCYAHSSSKENYDADARRRALQWLATGPDEAVCGFLRHNHAEFRRQHGSIFGARYARPKLLPIDGRRI